MSDAITEAGEALQSFPVRYVPIDSVRPDPGNVRLHGDRNVDAIKGSLRRFGFQKPIVVDRDGIVRAGSGTWRAAKELGLTHVPAFVTSLAGPDAVAFAIADNRTAELAE
jgi:ParB-like chromosome segregation protein Spo0J